MISRSQHFFVHFVSRVKNILFASFVIKNFLGRKIIIFQEIKSEWARTIKQWFQIWFLNQVGIVGVFKTTSSTLLDFSPVAYCRFFVLPQLLLYSINKFSRSTLLFCSTLIWIWYCDFSLYFQWGHDIYSFIRCWRVEFGICFWEQKKIKQ